MPTSEHRPRPPVIRTRDLDAGKHVQGTGGGTHPADQSAVSDEEGRIVHNFAQEPERNR